MESRDIVPEDQLTGEDDPGKVWPMGEVKPDFKLYPGKVEFGGHVYCIDLGEGLVKVGRTSNPQARLRSHFVDALRFGITPVRVWISPAHKEFADSEHQMLLELRDEFSSTGPESFRGGGAFELVQQWWGERTVFPPGQTREERERSERAEEKLKNMWRSSTTSWTDHIERLLQDSTLMWLLPVFFSKAEPHERQALTKEIENHEGMTEDQGNEVLMSLHTSDIAPVTDIGEATWLDAAEYMILQRVRIAKLDYLIHMRERGEESPAMERLIDTVPNDLLLIDGERVNA